MTIAVPRADYNEVARDRMIHEALKLGLSFVDSGQENKFKFFGTDSVSKISKLARRIKLEKRKQERLEQFA